MDIETMGENSGDAPAPNQDDTAVSSPALADAGSEQKDILSVVDSALSEEPEDSPPSEDTEAESSESEDTQEEPSGDPTEDELKAMRPQTADRIKQLLSERNSAREEAEARQKDAEQWAKIEAFRKQEGLTPDELANSIQIAALMRNDPGKAVEVLTPVWQSLLRDAGVALSPEMEQQVRQGDLRREHAQDMARSQAEAERAKRQLEARTQAEAERKQQEQIQTHVNSIRGAATTWEQKQMSSDPDFDLKRDLIAQTADLKMRTAGVLPETTQAMVAILDEAKAEVESRIAAFRPAPRQSSVHRNGVSARASNGSEAKPASYLDALEIGLGR